MRVALLLPPMGALSQPALSLPSLTAYLRVLGHEVHQQDVGIKCLDAMLTPDYLRAVRTRIRKRLDAGAWRRRPRKERGRAHRNLLVGDSVAEWAIANILRAKEILRSREQLLDGHLYGLARNAVEDAFSMLSAAYHPFHIQFNDISYGRRLTLDDILDVAADEEVNPFIEVLRDRVLAQALPEVPPVVGISATYFGQLFSGITLARLLKARSPATHVVMGGAAVTSAEQRIREHRRAFRWVDSYVFGEGETALAHLLEIVASGHRVPNRMNKLFMPSDRRSRRVQKLTIHNTGEREDFDALPTPDYAGLNLQDYLVPEIVFMLSNARGCYWRRCAFCNVSLAFNDQCRRRTGERIFRDIAVLQRKHGARWIFFADDSVPPARCREIAGFVRTLDRPLFWLTEARFEKAFTDELLREMYRGGCRQLIFGNESGNQRVLDLMRKGTRLSEHRRIIRAAHAAGIAVHLQNFLGFPGETAKEAEDTVKFLVSERDRVASWALGTFHVAEHSPVHREPGRFGVRRLRSRSRQELVPSYRFTTRPGDGGRRVADRAEDAKRRLTRAYPRNSFFIDGPVGSHALFYMLHHGLSRLERLFPPPPVPGDLFACRPRLRPTAIVRECGRSNGRVLYDPASGRCLTLGSSTRKWLSLADGSHTMESLAAVVANAHRARPAEGASRAADVILTCIDLRDAGIMDLQGE